MNALGARADCLAARQFTHALLRCEHEERAFVLHNPFGSRGWLGDSHTRLGPDPHHATGRRESTD